jgi:hypothetical protein
MAFDEKVFQEDLKNPEVLSKVFELVKGTEVVTNYTKTLQEQYFEQNKSKEHGFAYGNVDKVFEELGIKKPDNMKTSDYAAQIAKEKLQLQKELEVLKAEKSGVNVDEKVKAIEAKYQKELQESTSQYTSKLSELENQLINERTTNQVNNNIAELSVGVGNIKFMESVPKAIIDKYTKFQLDMLAKNATIENGVKVWNDENGKPIKNQNHLNASTEEVLKSVFKDFIQVGAAGGNAQGSSVNSSKMEGNVLVLSNNNFTTKAQFAEQYKKDLAAQAKTMADKDASDIYKATKKFYNIDTMKEG